MRKSFSLLEVVFACTVLILFMLAGIILFGNGIRNAVIAKHRLTAVYLGNKYLEEMTVWRDNGYFNSPIVHRISPTVDWSSAPASPSGTYDGVTYTSTGPNAVSLAGGNGYDISVVLTWTDFGKPYSITLHKFLLDWQR